MTQELKLTTLPTEVETCPHPEVRKGSDIINRVKADSFYCLACGEEI